ALVPGVTTIVSGWLFLSFSLISAPTKWPKRWSAGTSLKPWSSGGSVKPEPFAHGPPCPEPPLQGIPTPSALATAARAGNATIATMATTRARDVATTAIGNQNHFIEFSSGAFTRSHYNRR